MRMQKLTYDVMMYPLVKVKVASLCLFPTRSCEFVGVLTFWITCPAWVTTSLPRRAAHFMHMIYNLSKKIISHCEVILYHIAFDIRKTEWHINAGGTLSLNRSVYFEIPDTNSTLNGNLARTKRTQASPRDLITCRTRMIVYQYVIVRRTNYSNIVPELPMAVFHNSHICARAPP